MQNTVQFSAFNPTDKNAIASFFTQVFSASEGESEGLLIGTLVQDLITSTDDNDIYGFTAKQGNQLIGSLFFTRLTFDDSKVDAFILSPVAVHTDYQGQGIGQQLIRFGLDHLKAQQIALVFTYGDPKFYQKVGFQTVAETTIKAPLTLSYPFGWLCQSLTNKPITPITGDSYCVAALNHAKYW